MHRVLARWVSALRYRRKLQIALGLLLLVACAEDKEAPAPTADTAGVPLQQQTTPVVTTPPNTYRNAGLGFELEVPLALGDGRAADCRPQLSQDGTEVMLGSNLSIRVTSTNVRTASEASNALLTSIGAAPEFTTDVTVSGVGGVRTEYRLQPSNRFGIVTFVVRGGRLYTLVFEARDMTQCGGLATPELYDAVVASFRFT
jgi:hypothetical protein